MFQSGILVIMPNMVTGEQEDSNKRGTKYRLGGVQGSREEERKRNRLWLRTQKSLNRKELLLKRRVVMTNCRWVGGI